MLQKLTFKSTILRALPGVLFVSILGTLMHFVYDWSGQNALVGLFAATNESTWEHMKLFFFPMLLYLFLEASFRRDCEHFLSCSDSAALLAGTILIPALFYTYSGTLGFHLPVLDILTFYVSVLAAFWIRSITSKRTCPVWLTLLLRLLVLLFLIGFLLFTFNPPALGIFAEP